MREMRDLQALVFVMMNINEPVPLREDVRNLQMSELSRFAKTINRILRPDIVGSRRY